MELTVEQPPSTAPNFKKLCGTLDERHQHPVKLVPILQAAQKESWYLPQEVLTCAATASDVPPARVLGVATPYVFKTIAGPELEVRYLRVVYGHARHKIAAQGTTVGETAISPSCHSRASGNPGFCGQPWPPLPASARTSFAGVTTSPMPGVRSG